MRISKKFEFDYGHRVWNQKLDISLSLDDKLVCRHLHGHRGVVDIIIEGDLKDGMVTDFKHLNWFKHFIDTYIDHKFIVDKNDPLINFFLPGLQRLDWIPDTHWEVYCDDPLEQEWYESFTIVDFVPTSENLSIWFHGIIMSKMKGFKIGVIFSETPKTCAIL